jgi:hypothetical protein
MVASGARPEREQWSPDGAASIDIEARVVDVLDRVPAFVPERSRHLLLSRVERRIGGPLQVPDYPLRRQWFVGLVDACREHPGGLTALAAAVADLEPASSLAASAVRRLSADWNARAARADPAVGADGDVPADGTAPDPPSGSGVVAGGMVRPREPERLGLSGTELRMLAQVFHQATAARQVLAAAGLPQGRQPIWSGGMSPAEFWGEVNHLLAAGVLRDGRRRVLAAAAELYPANPVFAARMA